MEFVNEANIESREETKNETKEETTENNENTFKEIVFFGCWNDGLCPSNEVGKGKELTETMNALKTYIGDNKNNIVDVIVAGDNYYQDKEKSKDKTEKKITINEQNFKSGFNCLKDAVGDIHTTVLLGNHDVKYIEKFTHIVDNDIVDNDIVDNDIVNTNPQEPCLTSILEKNIALTNEFDLFNFQDIDKNYKLYNNTMIIMIDSSIFDDDDDDDNDKLCYKHFDTDFETNIISEEKQKDPKDIQSTIIKKQKEFMNTIVEKLKEQTPPIQNIIFTAHHPIIGIKQKKLDIMNKFTEYIYYFCSKIKTEVNADAKFYHLCADVHNFQIVDIVLTKTDEEEPSDPITIRQYVVGTGGAEKDKFDGFNDLENETETKTKKKQPPLVRNLNGIFTTQKPSNIEDSVFNKLEYAGEIIKDTYPFSIKFKQWCYSVTNGFLTFKIPNSANQDIEFYFHSNPKTTMINDVVNEESKIKGGANKKRRLSKKTNKRKSTMKKNRRPSSLKRRRSLRKHFHTRKY
jgi:hypothetical protein